MPSAAQPVEAVAVERRFLTFRMDRRLYALPAEEVSEVIRVPAVARVPQGPKSLMGVANLRGSVLPVASLRGLLGQTLAQTHEGARAIILDGAAPVDLAVDSVEALISVGSDQVDTGPAATASQPGERLRGAFRGADDGVIKILDIQSLLAEAFTPRARAPRAQTADAGLLA